MAHEGRLSYVLRTVLSQDAQAQDGGARHADALICRGRGRRLHVPGRRAALSNL